MAVAQSQAPVSRWQFILQELKPKGPLLTPFNVLAAFIIVGGLIITAIRFIYGLGAVTNLSQEYPWGLWIGFDVITGVAFAGGAYIITLCVYVLNVEKLQPIVRPAVLNGFLSYVFYAGALVFDLGRPWHIVNPIIGNKFGYNSVMFLVAWHFLLYMLAELLEFSPVIAEWLNAKKAKRILERLTLGTVIVGVTLSTLHQAGLGALFLFSKTKLHPLWYSEFIPVLFVVSSVFAGISMILLEGTISHKVFRDRIDPRYHATFEEIVFSLAKGAAVTMYVYLFLKFLVFVHGQHWEHLATKWGAWFLVEVIIFTLIPCALFTHGYRQERLDLVRIAAVMTLLGILLNRLNVSIIAFNWNLPVTYYPTVWEVWVSLMVVFAEILVFRWVVNRMPVFSASGH